MITEKKYCKKCGQVINTDNPLNILMGRKYVELDDGIYCLTCATEEIKRRRRKK